MYILLALTVVAAPQEFELTVHEYTLKNGLKILVYVDTSAPVASVQMYYRVGAYDEQTGHTGISHMLEHMTFKHSQAYRPGDFDRILDSVGAQKNGFTSTYFTGYFETFSREHWELGLRLEAARMSTCVFSEPEFATEQQVVIEERRLHDNNPPSILRETYKAVALLANPQRNPVIGWSEDIKSLTVPKLNSWYRRYYNPANAVLVVAGHVQPADVLRQAERYFGKLKGKSLDRPILYHSEPTQTGERRVIVRRQVSQPMMLIGYHTPGVKDSSYLAGYVAARLLASGRNSRLYQALVIQQELAVSCAAWNAVTLDPGLLEIQVVPKAESLIPYIETSIEKEIARLASEPPTEQEMTRVANGLLADDYYNRDAIHNVASQLASSYIIHGDWRHFLRERKRLLQVTGEQVSEFCRRYLVSNNRTVGILLPEH